MVSVLVVEDNPMNMELVAYLLKSNRMEVTQAFDGLEALEALNKSIFDLILLDIQLPGMDGMEILKRIKGKSKPEAYFCCGTYSTCYARR